MRIVGVNGIATHGEGNIDEALADLRVKGFQTVDVPLPKRHFISAWWGHRADADEIFGVSSDGDVALAHSFGGPRVLEAIKLGRKFRHVFLVRPAMSSKARFPIGTKVTVFHSPDDLPVRLGRWLPWHPFGDAGVKGLEWAENIETEGGHNADFEGAGRNRLIGVIADRLRDFSSCPDRF